MTELPVTQRELPVARRQNPGKVRRLDTHLHSAVNLQDRHSVYRRARSAPIVLLNSS